MEVNTQKPHHAINCVVIKWWKHLGFLAKESLKVCYHQRLSALLMADEDNFRALLGTIDLVLSLTLATAKLNITVK